MEHRSTPLSKTRKTRILAGVAIAVVLAIAFFLPILSVRLSPTVWYPYDKSPAGYGSLTYRTFGYGAVYWSPDHYWVYLGSGTIQVTNSSASSITVSSVDRNGTAIFGYYTILSDSGGRAIATKYTTATFPTTAGQHYTLQVEGYGACIFSHWSNGVTSSELDVVAGSGDQTLNAIYNC